MLKPPIEGRIRSAGLLVLAGLAVQLITMSWAHPLSFMAFLIIGCPVMLAGILLFLYSLTAKG